MAMLGALEGDNRITECRMLGGREDGDDGTRAPFPESVFRSYKTSQISSEIKYQFVVVVYLLSRDNAGSDGSAEKTSRKCPLISTDVLKIIFSFLEEERRRKLST